MRTLLHLLTLLALAAGCVTPADAASKRHKHQNQHQKQHQHQRAVSYAQHPQALALAQTIAQEQGIDIDWVQAQMREAKFVPRIVQLMQPAPTDVKKNWQLYRGRFVTPTHLAAGLAFWQAYQADLLRAEREYGVPPRMVLGILGVETIYGRNTGGFRVLDALATLAFDYPLEHPRREARVAYFRGELGQFLVLAKKMNRAPKSYLGSYAGAMGMPQFMPSSWMKYAVDFDGDGKIDLWRSPADAVGSVAHYFKAYGYKPYLERPAGQSSLQALPNLAFQPRVVELENGSEASTAYPVDDNFFVITKYNDSYYYAAAVLELGDAIARVIEQEALKSTDKTTDRNKQP